MPIAQILEDRTRVNVNPDIQETELLVQVIRYHLPYRYKNNFVRLVQMQGNKMPIIANNLTSVFSIQIQSSYY
jgi:hypothetical protein